MLALFPGLHATLVLQATKSWVGPGNEAIVVLCGVKVINTGVIRWTFKAGGGSSLVPGLGTRLEVDHARLISWDDTNCKLIFFIIASDIGQDRDRVKPL